MKTGKIGKYFMYMFTQIMVKNEVLKFQSFSFSPFSFYKQILHNQCTEVS